MATTMMMIMMMTIIMIMKIRISKMMNWKIPTFLVLLKCSLIHHLA